MTEKLKKSWIGGNGLLKSQECSGGGADRWIQSEESHTGLGIGTQAGERQYVEACLAVRWSLKEGGLDPGVALEKGGGGN